MVKTFSAIFKGCSAFYIFNAELNTPEYLKDEVK